MGDVKMSEPEISTPAVPKRSREPIPMPAFVRWREFRAGVLPLFMFTGGAVACAWLWTQTATSTGIAGITEGVRSVVASPRLATVQHVVVAPFQMVEAGDTLAVVLPIDPRAELGLLQAELDLARMSLQPSIAEENAMNFEQIRVDLLRTKSELAVARVNLERAENQVRRNAPLFAEKLVSEEIYDLAAKARDAYQAEVFEKSNAVAHIQKRVGELEILGLPQAGTNSLLAITLRRLNVLLTQSATNWHPITLRAPIAGMISAVTHCPGETALEGEPLVTINSTVSERVVGYLRQPYQIDPQVGMSVVMTTRERKPRRLTGSVMQVGAQTEIITNALAFVRTGALVDSGLPIAISLPPGVPLRPGEILDLMFRAASTNDVPSVVSIVPPAANLRAEHAAKQ